MLSKEDCGLDDFAKALLCSHIRSIAQVFRSKFLSYIQMAVVGTEVYPKAEDVKGYLYVDEDSGSLCLKVEHVYVELSPKLGSEAWKGFKDQGTS